MKTSCILLSAICSCFLSTGVNAQQFSVTGEVVVGGGGTSEGLGFSITGTIGQAEDTAPSQNGR